MLYRLWWTVHYLVGFTGVLAGGLAGVSAANEPAKAWGWAIGRFAAVCTSLVTFLGPLQKAERYWKTSTTCLIKPAWNTNTNIKI